MKILVGQVAVVARCNLGPIDALCRACWRKNIK